MFKRTFATGASPLKKTKLYDFHVGKGGKMVEFAGYKMPVQYQDGVLQSHLWTRENASIFDVSHMLQTKFFGKDKTKFLESLVVADLAALPNGSSTLSLFTNEKGGIIDDTVINKQSDKNYYVVSNAGCADKDLAHIRDQLSSFTSNGGDCQFEVLDHVSLIALQGPAAARLMERLTGQDLKQFAFMSGKFMDIAGIPCYVSRCGYTGEDGFEISVPHERVVELCEVLLNDSAVKMAGLGARDSLRLEAGLCLYGHDLNDDISPVEGALTWTIGQRRRKEGGFLGAEFILPQIKGGVEKRRIGLIVQGAPARGIYL
jgi:aminomethyltransferase